MKVYIFVKDKFKLAEDFNNQYRKDYSYETWKDKLTKNEFKFDIEWKVIDSVEEASAILEKGFDNDDIILCVGAEKVYGRIPFYYFSTLSTKDFFHYLRFMKIKHKID